MEDDMEMDETPKKEDNKKEEHHKVHDHHKIHEHNKEYMEHKEHKHHKTFETAAWTLGIIAVVLAIALVAAIVTKGFAGSGTTGTGTSVIKAISQDELRTKTQAYLQTIVQGQNVSVGAITDEGDLYTMRQTI